LYPGCKNGLKKLDSTLELLQWKATHGVSDKGFGELLKYLKNMLSKDNELPTTTYEAKQLVCPLGLEVQKIHACPNDCILRRRSKQRRCKLRRLLSYRGTKLMRNDVRKLRKWLMTTSNRTSQRRSYP
jgi:hypothetical protein